MVAYHSYQGQDRFVVAATAGQRGGFFLDSGASSGTKGSNTLTLERDFGWTGICVEPNDELFAQLAGSRSCVCLNTCLYTDDGEIAFFEAAGVYGGILTEYEPGHLRFARAQAAAVGGGPDVVIKPTRSVASILHEHDAPRVIDYWSLDTEGSELAILRSFPFGRYTVRFLTVEHNNHESSRREIAEFLGGHGFRRVAVLGIDDVYAWSGLPGPEVGAWRSRAFVRRRGRG